MASPVSAGTTVKSAVLLVLTGIVSVQFGAGVAKSLFDDADPTTIVWLRLSVSALVMLAWTRPRLHGRSARDWQLAIGFGATLGLMNWAFYHAIARIPLGMAVMIEFAGPLTLAVVGSRRARDLLWVLLAGVGVLLLGLEPGSLTLAGIGFALLAGAAWAAYILLSKGTGARWPGLDGLAVASIVAALLLTPLTLGRYGDQLGQPRVLVLGVVVAVLSSVIPYSCELVALRTLRPGVFGILMSLEPGVAALAGLAVLGETLGVLQWLAVLCVVAASVGATRDWGAEPSA